MTENYIPSRFDREAAQFDTVPARVELARAVADTIAGALPLHHGMHMMDYGTGTGLVALRLQPLVGTITAADSSREMLAVLQSKIATSGIARLRTVELNLEAQPAPPDEFDLIVSSMTLHHVRDTTALFLKFHTALKPGGWLAVADLDIEDGRFHRELSGVYHHGFDRNELCRALRSAGFPGPTTRDAHRFMKPAADGNLRTYSVFLATARKPL